MAAIDDLIADIEASRPAGYFAAARPLLRLFCEKAIESRRLRVMLKDAGGVLHGETLDRLCVLAEEQCELAEVLGLLPGDRGKPPPRLN